MNLTGAEFLIALVSFLVGGAVVSAGFIVYVERQAKRAAGIDRKLTFALVRIGNLYNAAGMKERYTEDLLRLLMAIDGAVATPLSSEVIPE